MAHDKPEVGVRVLPEMGLVQLEALRPGSSAVLTFDPQRAIYPEATSAFKVPQKKYLGPVPVPLFKKELVPDTVHV